MISTSLKKMRSAGILLLAVLLVSLGMRPALAAGDDNSGDDKKAPASDSSGSGDSAPAAAPQLQLDDEGPSAREQKKARPTVRLAAPAPTDDQDDKPFYKSPIFWVVTGVLVAGAVGAVIYSTSGSRGSLQPCPANVTLSLGCYGAGRN